MIARYTRPLGAFSPKLSIAFMLTVSIAIILTVVVSIVTWLEVREEQSKFQHESEERGLSLATNLNDILANYLYHTKIAELRDMSAVLESDPEITYVNIFLPDGRLIVEMPANENDAGYPALTQANPADVDAVNRGQSEFRFQEDDLQATVPIQIGSNTIGGIQFGLDGGLLREEVAKIVLQHVWQGTLAIVLGIGLIYPITRRVTRPLQELAASAEKIGRGNLDETISVKGGKESAALGNSLNHMRLQLKELYDGMESKVADRTKEITEANQELERNAIAFKATNKELEEAQDGLVRAEKLATIGQLAGGMAHDLRNPLGAIKNVSYMLGKKLRDEGIVESIPKVERYLGIIEQQIDRSDYSITELMSYAKMRPPELVEIGLEQALEESLTTLVLNDNITLSTVVEANLFPVMGDAEQLQRVFLNLANNAQQAMPDGGFLNISLKNVEEHVEVAFTDTGQGVSEENMRNIFDPLFTTKIKGTGLGLAVCQEIIFQHDGIINVRQNENPSGGTIFELAIPASVARQQV